MLPVAFRVEIERSAATAFTTGTSPGSGSPLWLEHRSERHRGNLVGSLVGRQAAAGPEPSREPEDHSDDAERGDGPIDVAQASGLPQLADGVTDQINVDAHAPLDLLPVPRR